MGKRDGFASNLGFILAAAGAAVGLGNIWKFPGKVGSHGGGTFIVIYLIITAFLGFSILLCEITLGRHTSKNSVGAFNKINRNWNFVGKLGLLSGFVVLSYYSVVGGWVIRYVLAYFSRADFGTDSALFFTNFVTDPAAPIFWHIIFIIITAVIVVRGVSNGVEKMSKILMPILLLILFVIALRAVTLPGAEQGLEFLFTVNLADVNGEMIVSALGQAFFSLSIGTGVMITYGSYVSKNDSLTKSVAFIVLLDTFVAVLCGFAIICSVFATNPSLIGSSGSSFAFVSLPNIFAQIQGGIYFGLLFFVLLFFAALTSSMSILEGLVAYLCEEFSFTRKFSTIILSIAIGVLGCCYSLSHGAMHLTLPWFDGGNGVKQMDFHVVLELFTDNLLIPITALFICVFVGYIWKPKHAKKEIEIGKSGKFYLGSAWGFMIKFICPIAIVVILFVTMFLGQNLS